jgi:flagellar hook-associated protein 2
MSGVSSGVGLVSGINYQSLINSLLAIDKVPENIVQSQITEVNTEKSAYITLSSELSGIQSIGNLLALPQSFEAATASSSNPNILTATASEGAAVGSYQFQVAQLVTTQQTISQGFASATSTPVGAGTITISQGGGEAFSQTDLSQLNGGLGIQRGQFRITDSSGNSSIIDTSGAVTLDDVIKQINSATNTDVTATVGNQNIVLTDNSGGSGSLTIQDLAGGSSAASLGISGTATGTLNGSKIYAITNTTQLSSLNDGRGVAVTPLDQLTSASQLSLLNNGTGVQANGSSADFKVSLADGSNFSVTLGAATTIGQALSAINSAGGSKITASIGPGGQGLQIVDHTTGTGTFGVTALNSSTAASQLGILTTGTGGVLSGTPLSASDFQINLADGTNFKVALGTSETIGDVISAINSAGGSKITASIDSSGQSIKLQDNTTGSGTLSVAALNNSTAAANLGLTAAASGSSIRGAAIQSGLDSVLVSSLNGGNGIPLGKIQITDRQGNTGQIDLSNAKSVSAIIAAINNNSVGVKVTAALNSAGDGIAITDVSGHTGTLSISDVDSTTAAALGINGTFNTSSVVGKNLQRQFISSNTQLSQLNGGNGIGFGTFSIINSAGAGTNFSLDPSTFNTVGDVLSAINNAHAGVTASIDPTGSGILITDAAGGHGKLTIKDVNGTSASDLKIAGTATATTIDGSFQTSITVSATDTLTSLQTKINQLGLGVTTQIINDGSTTNPYRLVLTSDNTGRAGRFVIDSGTTNLNTSNLVAGQDAAVLLGGSGSSQPLLVTSSTNSLNNLIKGVSINLTGASTSPVTLNVAQDPTGVESDLANFVTQFNTVTTQIGTYTQFNTNTNQGGLLLGDPTTNQIQSILSNLITNTVSGTGKYKTLADIGITIDSNSQLTFNTNTFETAFGTDPTAVQSLFSEVKTGLGTQIANAGSQLTDPINGIVTLQESTLDARIKNYTDYFNQLNALVNQQQSLLQLQFANLESTIASLQSQSSVISAFNSAAAATAASSASTTPSSSSSSSSSSGSSSSSSGTTTG